MHYVGVQKSKIDYGAFISGKLSSNNYGWRSMVSTVFRQNIEGTSLCICQSMMGLSSPLIGKGCTKKGDLAITLMSIVICGTPQSHL